MLPLVVGLDEMFMHSVHQTIHLFFEAVSRSELSRILGELADSTKASISVSFSTRHLDSRQRSELKDVRLRVKVCLVSRHRME